MPHDTSEHKRLHAARMDPLNSWKKWGPYVSERMWGTVREDYSPDGNAWNYTTHDLARSVAYRWGEDGLGAISDINQILILSWAFWNGEDPILKERLFGLNPYEGNHGEDVKECYFYLDSTPTHSYMRFLYKYPQKKFPYDQLVEENKKRSTTEREFELSDTGAFDEGRYFDITLEYAKSDIEDICIRLEITNQSDKQATIDILPQLFFRNQWSWDGNLSPVTPTIKKGSLSGLIADPTNLPPVGEKFRDYKIAPMHFFGPTSDALLFTNNETHNERVWNSKSRTPFVKDAFHRTIVTGENCCNPDGFGTKAAFHYKKVAIPPKQSKVFYFRLTNHALQHPLEGVERIIALRKKEADDFYETVHPKTSSAEERLIQRQALAGMLFSKQFYCIDVKKWLKGDNPHSPPPKSRYQLRNNHWKHLEAMDIISMPDKWEYPWFAAWDLAFHTVALSLVDIEFAKSQIHTVLQHQYQHPNGQIPSYEWCYSDLNPPVQAWALWRLYNHEKQEKGKGDTTFLEVCFLKLERNFNWWVNKVDRLGNNFFEGGFLGLDNISVIDRSLRLGDGGYIEQSDGTGWMGFFSLTMMRIALELAKTNPSYQVMATIYLEHFFYIANAMQKVIDIPGERFLNMWDEEDGFFYDVVAYPNGSHQLLKVRSFVGIIPAYSLDFLDDEELKLFPSFHENFRIFSNRHSLLTQRFMTKISRNGKSGTILSMMKLDQLQRVLRRIMSPSEFLATYGLRSLSKFHASHPFTFEGSKVQYEPAESLERIKGGNSNWRGPIWFPTNYLFMETLNRLQEAVGGNWEIETLEGGKMELHEVIALLKQKHINLFKKDSQGQRPVHVGNPDFQKYSNWQDLLLFYEHYHPDTGRGLGAAHQTGWSGLVANMISELYSSKSACEDDSLCDQDLKAQTQSNKS